MKNRVIPIIFLILLCIVGACLFRQYFNRQKIVATYNDSKALCLEGYEGYSKEFCNIIFEHPPVHLDTLTFFNQSIFYSIFNVLVYFTPLLIMMASIWTLSTEYVSGFAKSYLIRKNHFQYLKRMFKKAYHAIWILPGVFLIAFILAFIFSGHFDYTDVINTNIATFEEQYLKTPILFIICYLVNLALISIFYVNLALIFMKKNKNKIVAILESYICFVGIEIINEALINGLIFYKTLHIDIGSIFNLLDNYTFSRVYNCAAVLIRSSLYALASFLLVYKLYSSKEKVIQDCELLKGDD